MNNKGFNLVLLSIVVLFGSGAGATEISMKTDWGAPNLQGIWTTATLTPLERSVDQSGTNNLTEEEAQKLESRTAQLWDNFDKNKPPPGTVGGYNRVWLDPALKLLPGRQASLIVSPANGKIPWRADAKAKSDAERARYGVGPYNKYSDLDTGERCISDGVTMVPLQPYNMNFQIIQTPDHVAIVHEMYHEYRIIPLDNRPHINEKVGQWLGDARGRWDGDTLIIETSGFADKDHYHWAWPWRASRSTHRVTETMRRVDKQTIDYRFTIEDPSMFTEPWTVASPMTTDQASRGVTAGMLYEYACHEGNYALPNVLRGSRAQEDLSAVNQSLD